MLHDSATIQANHERFISRVAESEVVWGLQSPTMERLRGALKRQGE